MSRFVIDGFDFGIDDARSSIVAKDGFVDLKLVSDDMIIQHLMTQDEHVWNWLIQPPFLYVLGLPCNIDSNGDFQHEISEQELDDYDIALYVMEHFDVSPCRITRQGMVVTAHGKVQGIRRTPLEFDIEWIAT